MEAITMTSLDHCLGFMLWFKQRFEDGLIGLVVVFASFWALGVGSSLQWVGFN